MALEINVPNVEFKFRERRENSSTFEWVTRTSQDIFGGKRVVVFALPGAFTPTCSSTHLPAYEVKYDEIIEQDIDEVYCLSVNDAFVMNAWFNNQDVVKVKVLPDGSGHFTRHLGMLVDKDNLGFGMRSQRYSMVVDNGRVEAIFVEDGKVDNYDGDPFKVSDALTMLDYLEQVKEQRRAYLKKIEDQSAEISAEADETDSKEPAELAE